MSNPNPPLENLKPFQPGQSGNPAGKPKGLKNWSTVVQELLDDEELLERLLTEDKPKWLDGMKSKRAAEAIVAAMVIRSVGGDHKAAEWLRKTGYGDRLVLEDPDGLFKQSKLTVEIVDAPEAQPDSEPSADTP